MYWFIWHRSFTLFLFLEDEKEQEDETNEIFATAMHLDIVDMSTLNEYAPMLDDILAVIETMESLI